MKPVHDFQPASEDVSRTRADNLIDWLRDYAGKRIDSKLFDERRCVPPYVVLDFGTAGLLGLQIPEEFGGLALRYRDFLRVLEQLAAIDLSLASLVFIHNANGVRPIQGYARPELRAELLPVLAAGRQLSAFALTEPAAGSNLPGLEARAVPDGRGGWRLSGIKRWNASGWAGIFTVFARLVDDRGGLGHVSAFVVTKDDPGLRFGPESLTMGVRSIMQNSLILDDVHVGPDRVLGEIGKGMDLADEALLMARLCMGAISLGGMKRCAQLMMRYADRRKVSTGLLSDSPITHMALDQVVIRIAAVQALVDCLAGIMDEGAYPAEEACMIAKIVASDAMWDCADDMVQMLGGRGFMENNIAPQILRDCRMLRIGEGANELMSLSVGRRVLHSAPFRALLRDRLQAGSLDAALRADAERLLERCLAADAPFADRSSAMAWAHFHTGRIATHTLVLAAIGARPGVSDAAVDLAAARNWAEIRLEAARTAALAGPLPDPQRNSARHFRQIVGSYARDIGDIEQAPPGIEEAIDPLLRRSRPAAEALAPHDRLPGAAADWPSLPAGPAAVAAPGRLEDKRRLAARKLKQKLAGLKG